MPKTTTRKPSAAQEAKDNELTAAVTYVLARRPILAADAPAYRRRRPCWRNVKTTLDLELAPDTVDGAESCAANPGDLASRINTLGLTQHTASEARVRRILALLEDSGIVTWGLRRRRRTYRLLTAEDKARTERRELDKARKIAALEGVAAALGRSELELEDLGEAWVPSEVKLSTSEVEALLTRLQDLEAAAGSSKAAAPAKTLKAAAATTTTTITQLSLGL